MKKASYNFWYFVRDPRNKLQPKYYCIQEVKAYYNFVYGELSYDLPFFLFLPLPSLSLI